MWDLSSLTRGHTHIPCIAGWILNPWTTGKSPYSGHFQLSEDAWSPWLVAPLIFKATNDQISFFSIASLWHYPTSLFSSETLKSTSRPPDNPEYPPHTHTHTHYFKVSWLETIVSFATWFPFWHLHRFSGLWHGHLGVGTLFHLPQPPHRVILDLVRICR